MHHGQRQVNNFFLTASFYTWQLEADQQRGHAEVFCAPRAGASQQFLFDCLFLFTSPRGGSTEASQRSFLYTISRGRSTISWWLPLFIHGNLKRINRGVTKKFFCAPRAEADPQFFLTASFCLPRLGSDQQRRHKEVFCASQL